MGFPVAITGLLSFVIIISCRAQPEIGAGPEPNPAADTAALSHPEIQKILTAMRQKYRQRIPHWDRVLIVDYRKPIDAQRLYLIDGQNGAILLRTTVAHGVNSGRDYATQLSNELGSLKSSAGAYLTGGTYNGTFGYSLKLKGLDNGINSNAEARHIILHSSRLMATRYSWGCFAVPDAVHRKIIDMMKGGRLLYVVN